MQQLENLLLSHLGEADSPQLFGFTGISRRGFLAGGAAGAAAMLSACTESGDPVVQRRGRGVELHYRGGRWHLDPDAFAPGASVLVERLNGGFAIRLRNARLAGTQLRVDMLAEIIRQNSEWIAVVSAPSLGISSTMALAAWMAGNPASRAIGPISFPFGGMSVAGDGGRLSIASDGGFSLVARATASPFRLRGGVSGRAEAIILAAAAPSSQRQSVAAFVGSDGSATTEFTLLEPNAGGRPPLTLPGSGRRQLLMSGIDRAGGELFDTATGPRHALVAEGLARLSRPEGAIRAELMFERAAVFASSGRVGLAGKVAGGQLIRLGGFSAQTSANGGSLIAHFVRGKDPILNGITRIDRLHAPMERGGYIAFDLEDNPVSLPVGSQPELVQPTNASESEPLQGEPESLNYGGELASDEGGDGPLSADEAALFAALGVPQNVPGVADHERQYEVVTRGAKSGVHFFGTGTIDTIPLDTARISLRRGEDLLNLTFAFEGYDLDLRGTTARPVAKRRDPKGAAQITVELPPQHVWETVYPKPATCGVIAGNTKARMARRSRLVFTPKDNSWDNRPIDFDALLDWTALKLSVDPRARSNLAAGIEEQLRLPGIDEKDTLAKLFERVAAKFYPPGKIFTSLELASRLHFSPDETAQWQKQELPGKKDVLGIPLWNVRLDAVGRKSVRALWSSYFHGGRLPGAVIGKDDELAMPPSVTLALTPEDHWGIVAQTSVYGIPALRSIPPKEGDPFDTAVRKVPRANVVRQSPAPTYIREADRLACNAPKPPPKCEDLSDTGVALAFPFDDADISLTGIGAIFSARWEGDPPHWRPDPAVAPDLLSVLPRRTSLEQLNYQSWLGRDVRVLAVTKGYLYPLGMRAAFIELSERRFYPDKDGHAVAHEVKRSFIRCRPTRKRFPALNQPFATRDFPVEWVAMRTLVTPDLVLPDSYPLEDRIGEALRKIGGDIAATSAKEAFWPKIETPNGIQDFQFEWATDGAEAISGPLIFVASGPSGSEKPMAALAQYYRGRDSVMRTMRVNGSRHRYAIERNEGEARFDTDNWRLSVRGQLFREGSDEESFTIDARMNGADQPPFYPVVEQAQIIIQPVDRLSGKPQGLVTVAFEEGYVRHGFGSPLHKSEIYLRVLAPKIAFDVQKRADLTGGASGPSSYVAGLSRKTGVVGGTVTSGNALVAPAKPSAAPGAGASDSIFEIGAALDNKFNPAQFFGFEGGAKLLGILDFKDILDIVDLDFAPKLVEEIGYGALETSLPSVKDAARFARMASETFFVSLSGIEKAANEALLKIDPKTKLTFKDLYPDLKDALEQARVAFSEAFDAIEKAATIGDVPRPAARLVAAAKPVLREFDRLARDPLPPAADDILKRFQGYWQSLRDFLGQPRETLLKLAEKSVTDELEKGLCDVLNSPELAGALFGASGASCSAFVANPADVFINNGKVLLGNALGQPLGEMFAYLREQRDILLRRFRLKEDEIRRYLVEKLDQAARQLAPRLASYDANLHDIRTSIDRIEAARAIAAALAAKLGADFDKLQADPEALKKIAAVFGQDVVMTALSEVAKLRDLLHPGLDANGTAIPVEVLVGELQGILVSQLTEMVKRQVETEANRLAEIIRLEIDARKSDLMKRITGTLQTALIGLTGTQDFVRVARFAQQAVGWCDKAVAVAQSLGDGVTEAASLLDTRLENLRQSIIGIKVEPSWDAKVRDKVEELRLRMLNLLAPLGERLRETAAARSKLAGLPAAWGSIAAAIDPLQLILATRAAFVGQAEAISSDIVAMHAVLPASGKSIVAPVMRSLSDLIRGSTSVSGLPKAVDLIASVRDFIATLPSADSYAIKLRGAFDDALATAAALDGRLAGTLTAGDLDAALHEVDAYIAGQERQLAALIFQAVVLDKTETDKLDAAAASALVAIATKLYDLHHPLARAFFELGKFIGTDPAQIVIGFILSDAKLKLLQANIADIHVDDATLADLIKASTPKLVFDKANELKARWSAKSDPPLLAALTITVGLVEDFVSGNLAGEIVQRLRQAISTFGDHLREFLFQLVPTEIATKYDWSTTLKGGHEIFQMAREKKPAGLPAEPGPQKPDLILSANASVNLVNGKREFWATGELQPFVLNLLPGLQMVEIYFKPLTFSSRNGSAPKFDVAVDHVTIGPLLSFIETLKQYMQPDGNGLYIVPTDASPGIEVGFQFSSGLIQVGSLSFLNISLCVAARLHFDQQPAQFIFRFASEERPFVISNPPYGGAGYAELVVFAGKDRPPQLTLSFMFGGAAQLRFGPLRGEGRVMAGIGVRRSGAGTTLWAVFEAIGEGSIACFSISVAIRVIVWHYPDGVMRGQTSYKFTFKVGFLKYSYSVTASYQLSGKGSGKQEGMLSRSKLALACDANGEKWNLKVDVVRKDQDWSRYRRQIDHSLLT